MRVSAFVCLCAVLWVAAPAAAELNGYMTIKAQKQGEIKGSVTQKGREGSIMFVALNHEIVSPRDPASGLPTGQRMHKPLLIRKDVDRSTPALRNALTNNETLSTVTLRFWQPSPTGAEVQYLTVTLTNANIASIQHVMPNNKSPELVSYPAYEEIAFTYQTIEWRFTNGNVCASDDWTGSVGGSTACSASPAESGLPSITPVVPKTIPRVQKLPIRP